MSRRTAQRAIRKQFLQIQAEHLRFALRQDLEVVHPSASIKADGGAVWLETASSLLGMVLPRRWGRWLTVGLSVWRIGRLLDKACCAKKTAPGS